MQLKIPTQTRKFIAKKLDLNLDKANITTFITNNSPQYPLNVRYSDKYKEESVNTKFLRLQIGNHLNWESHIDQFVSKLKEARYAVRSMLYISNTATLKSIYFAYIHSTMK
jgi:hypothetical protein